MQNTGVYKIYFSETPEKVYIGSTSFIRKNSIKTGFHQRKYNHLNSLRRNKHYNQYLQRAFNKYGENSFRFEIIEECCENIVEKEQYWIDFYRSYKKDFGYNMIEIVTEPGKYRRTEQWIENHRNSLKQYYKNNTIYNKKIDENLIEKVKQLIDVNLHYSEICKQLDIKKSTYYNIKKLI